MGNNTENPMPKAKSGEELAQQFADFFLEKIQKIRRMFQDITPLQTQESDIPKIRSFSPMTESQVKKIIMEMQSKLCELDPIPTTLLKEVLHIVLPTTTKIANLSLCQGEFCSAWKTATVHPLLKKLGVNVINKNYRPVSNLSFLSSIIEHCMLSQFMYHCAEYNLLPAYQSAYRPHHSCKTSLIKVANDILWAMEHGKILGFVALDLSAAFNTVDHDLLLQVLHDNFGIEDKALHWSEMYLRLQSFKVLVNDKYSTEKDLTFSVPKGSCTGAFIFISYSSVLKDSCPENISLNGFADDHSIMKAFKPGLQNEKETLLELANCMADIKNMMDSV